MAASGKYAAPMRHALNQRNTRSNKIASAKPVNLHYLSYNPYRRRNPYKGSYYVVSAPAFEPIFDPALKKHPNYRNCVHQNYKQQRFSARDFIIFAGEPRAKEHRHKSGCKEYVIEQAVPSMFRNKVNKLIQQHFPPFFFHTGALSRTCMKFFSSKPFSRRRRRHSCLPS